VTNNCFKVKKEKAQDFEEVWKNRESHLLETPGFVRFALLRGDEEGEYVSQSTWESRAAFEAWTKSKQFAQAHGAKEGEEQPKKQEKRSSMAEMLEGPPRPRFYQAVTTTEKNSA
jgi:heme-degrading monooxygenase HmoA